MIQQISLIQKSINNKNRKGQVIQQQKTCQICLKQINDSYQDNQIFKCSHTFCKQCINNHIQCRINQFKQITCPQEGCEKKFNYGSQFFNKMTQKQKQKLQKMRLFYFAHNDPFLKKCSTQNCQGYIFLQQSTPQICYSCHTQFCKKCFMPQHYGSCDRSEINNLRANFQFGECKKCGFVVEKQKGCDHMKCKCGYQFCYVCGQHCKRVGDHVCYSEMNFLEEEQEVMNALNAFNQSQELIYSNQQQMTEEAIQLSRVLQLSLQLSRQNIKMTKQMKIEQQLDTKGDKMSQHSEIKEDLQRTNDMIRKKGLQNANSLDFYHYKQVQNPRIGEQNKQLRQLQEAQHQEEKMEQKNEKSQQQRNLMSKNNSFIITFCQTIFEKTRNLINFRS